MTTGRAGRPQSAVTHPLAARDTSEPAPPVVDPSMSSEESVLIMRVVGALSSLHDLQLLVLLMEESERWWSARSLAARSGTPVTVIQAALDRLAAKNLLDIRMSDEVRYCYAPGTNDLLAAGAAFRQAYHNNPAAIARLVTTHAGLTR